MCLFTNPTEYCNHPECIIYYASQINPSGSINYLIANILTLVEQQSFTLNSLIENHKLLNNNIEHLSQYISKANTELTLKYQDKYSIEGIFNWISNKRTFPMNISLISIFPDVIYKERGFGIEAVIFDQNNSPVQMPNGVSFIVSLFTEEDPPALLKTNISGKKILRGTVEIVTENKGNIIFQNIVINEVSSHYPNDKFCLVISCQTSGQIKPLVFNNISVRARKHKN